MVGDADYGAGFNVVGGDDVGAVHPDVSGFEAGGAAGRNLNGWETCFRLAWGLSSAYQWRWPLSSFPHVACSENACAGVLSRASDLAVCSLGGRHRGPGRIQLPR